MTKNLEYICELMGYQCYKNADGFIEGYKSCGRILDKKNDHVLRSDLKRIVTNARTMAEFIKFIEGMKPKQKKVKEDLGPALFDIESL